MCKYRVFQQQDVRNLSLLWKHPCSSLRGDTEQEGFTELCTGHAVGCCQEKLVLSAVCP